MSSHSSSSGWASARHLQLRVIEAMAHAKHGNRRILLRQGDKIELADRGLLDLPRTPISDNFPSAGHRPSMSGRFGRAKPKVGDEAASRQLAEAAPKER
jgi:hypothetical protein